MEPCNHMRPACILINRDKPVATPIHSHKGNLEAERVCMSCNHPESQHGSTGTRPCLASVGNLFDPDFCPCDEFRPKVAKAA